MLLLGLKKKIQKRNQKKLTNQVIEEITFCIKNRDEQIREVMNCAEVQVDPFPHIVVENFLPAEMYQHACEIWPDTKEFVSDGVSRFLLPVTYGCLENTNLPKLQKVFWRLFGEVIVNRYLKPILAEKFKPFLSQKMGLKENWQSFDLHQHTCNLRQDCLIVDKDAPNIRPHVDQLNMLAQIIIYFPSDNEHQNLGTTFYTGDASTTPNHLYDVKDPNNLKFAKKIPYTPNTLLAFIQSPTAWHGFERPPNIDPNYQRRLYLSPLFFSPEFMEKHYSGIYARTLVDEYFFDHRFLQKKNWQNIWGKED